MNCPNCNSENDSDNQFCLTCGSALTIEGSAPKIGISSAGQALFSITGQTLISVLMLYIIRSILLGLSFIQELRIPNFNITTTEIISIILYLLVLVLLVIFVRSLGYYWPRAFPVYSGIGDVLTAVLYVIALSVIYSMLKPVFLIYIVDPEPILILRILLSLLALLLLGRAVLVVYQSLPTWLDHLRTSLLTFPSYPINKKE